MMDYIYAQDGSVKSPSLENETTIGKQLHPLILELPAAKAVRYRREAISKTLDNVAQSESNLDVLSIACGHLREIEVSAAVRQGKVGKYLALDNDIHSLKVVEENYHSFGVDTLHASVRDILKGQKPDSKFDLIYSLGLYDYLNDYTAQTLTSKLFHKLNPNGQLIIANFHPKVETCAFMEAFCDWWLIYRDKSRMKKLQKLIPSNEIGNSKLYETPDVVYLDIKKRLTFHKDVRCDCLFFPSHRFLY